MRNPLRLIAGLTFDGDHSDEPRISAGEATNLFGPDSVNPSLVRRRDRRDVATHIARQTGTSASTVQREAS